MNIEIANRLVKLRKENGLSQEQLAEKLNISRQAVSKWERAEASPDTDNLICLAKLYNISLDELLKINDGNNIIKDEQEKEGFYIKDDEGNSINISDGKIIATNNKNETIQINNKNKKQKLVSDIVMPITTFTILIAYIICGTKYNLWHPLWIMFLLIPIIGSIVDCIFKKKITAFCYPILIVVIYLLLGFLKSLWHPYWFLFLTIPLFYLIFEPIDKAIKKKTE